MHLQECHAGQSSVSILEISSPFDRQGNWDLELCSSAW